MIQIIGYMIVVYGVARLLQTSKLSSSEGFDQAVSALGIAGLVILGVLLTNQANAVSSLSLP